MARTTAPPKPAQKERRPVGRPRSDGKPHLTRKRVFEVCAKLIAEHGYAGTGIRMMAAALDASPASLFNLFGSKDGLLNELIVFAAQPSIDFHKEITAETARLGTAPEVTLYKSIYEETLAVSSADRDYAALFYLPELRKPGLETAQLIRAKMIGHYRELIERGVQAGTLHADHVGLAAEQVFQLTETSIIAADDVTKISPQKQAASAADLCLRALLIEQNALAKIRKEASKLGPTIAQPLS